MLTLLYLIPGFSYKGCYVDNTNSQRAMNVASTSSSSMTINACISFCLSKSAAYPYNLVIEW